MAKAILTEMNVHSEALNSLGIYDVSGREVSSMHGPIIYKFHLTYISYDRFNMGDFPAEINTEDIKNIVLAPVINKEETQKEESKPKKPVSAINQLEVSEALG